MTKLKASEIYFLRSGEHVIPPANLYLDPFKGLTSKPNGRVIASVSATEGQTIALGNVDIDANGKLSNDLNGPPVGQVTMVEGVLDERYLGAMLGNKDYVITDTDKIVRTDKKRFLTILREV